MTTSEQRTRRFIVRTSDGGWMAVCERNGEEVRWPLDDEVAEEWRQWFARLREAS